MSGDESQPYCPRCTGAGNATVRPDGTVECTCNPSPFARGDRVHKAKGFRFPGIVAGCVQNQAGDWRVVVEAEHPDFRGMLHIYHPDQLGRQP